MFGLVYMTEAMNCVTYLTDLFPLPLFSVKRIRKCYGHVFSLLVVTSVQESFLLMGVVGGNFS